MSRIAYVDGAYVPLGEARVHIEDRGYQFADAVYEVCAVQDGDIVDIEPHFTRLGRSLAELRMAWPMSVGALHAVIREVVRRNRVRDGIVYLQVSRGRARRDHAFPGVALPVLVVTARAMSIAAIEARARTGVSVVSTPDIRWRRCDIKSVSLLPNVLAKQKAREAGAYEAWFVDDAGFVTEGASSNAWIVDGDGNLVTRYLDNAILSGITRQVVMELAARRDAPPVERPFTIDQAKAAREAFVTSTTSLVMPVTHIDGDAVGDGRPGPTSLELLALFRQRLGIAT